MTDPLAKLFGSSQRVKLLRLFLFNPRQPLSAADAAAHSDVAPRVARRELALFTSVKLLKRLRSGRATRYVLNTDFRYTTALQQLLLNARARGSDLYDKLRGAGSLKLIIVTGIFVGDWEGDLDILIVGDRVNDRVLRTKIRTLEAEIGRELRYALLTTPDFYYRISMSDRLLRDVMDFPHTIVFDRLNIGLK